MGETEISPFTEEVHRPRPKGRGAENKLGDSGLMGIQDGRFSIRGAI